MDEDGLAQSLRLDVQNVNDHCFRESRIIKTDEDGRQIREIVFWNRNISLTRSPANNVFLYESQQKDLRVFKHIRRNSTVSYRELSVMERVLKEVEPHQKELFVDFVGWFPSEDYIHLVMEYCPYGDISRYPGPLSEVEAWCNVLIVAQNPIRVKIADFGISKLSQKGITQPRTQAGTDGYMAPECFGINNRTKESSYTHAVDIWSLGCLAYYILTKEVPFKGKKDEYATYRALQSYCDGALGFPEEPLIRQRVSLSGRYFIQRLLAPVAENRPKALGQISMLDWVIPLVSDSASQDLTPTKISYEFAGSSTINRDTITDSQTQLQSNRQELFDVPPQRITEFDMDLYSSDLWHLVKLEKGRNSNIKKLRALLVSNANPNIRLKGYTALHIAAEQGPPESIENLLEFSADPKIRTKPRQETAIHLATCQGDFESFSRKLRLLLEKGADVDAKNFEGDTALHLAICRMANIDAIKVLVRSGASIEEKGRYGRAPLQYAIFLGREKIAAALLHYKANPNCADDDGLTLLHLAIRSNKISIEFLKRLIKAGADINQEDGNHHTPLYEAIAKGRHDAARLLLDHGANCNPHHPELERRFGRGFWQNFALRRPWASQ
ncbi:uncharacterized protein N7479_010876 [Penicillium vulpinum]|uniref:Protein kinase domain-containing protein n=1 Tax=Penicillium vulpinum TaxID=29845 RepID=A0A1V6S0H7_9EURO|nr:uncharacterized protein N7479_010876 [Penicillium vulpinum]KAJ5952463.1 hypothetical protein N7479_010876 [Penicillium vulpinum]OQE07368.1 hypothetical protein PENVUL_c014G09031 [Penicillium vulpinum]